MSRENRIETIREHKSSQLERQQVVTTLRASASSLLYIYIYCTYIYITIHRATKMSADTSYGQIYILKATKAACAGSNLHQTRHHKMSFFLNINNYISSRYIYIYLF